jgi:signal peptidase I
VAILTQEMRPMARPIPRLVFHALALFQIVAALLLVTVVAFLLAGTLPTLFGYESYVVYSGSMEPTIHVGDIAVVGPVKADKLMPGDIITFRTPQDPDTIVTHRLQNVDATGGHLSFQTKGDANDTPDQVSVDQNALLGKVVYSLPGLGFLVEFSKSIEGKVLMIVVPGVLLGLDYLRERLSRRKKAQAEMIGSPAPDAIRIRALLDGGNRALAAGYSQLAAQAADGVLDLDSANLDAQLLKARATGDMSAEITLLRGALAVNTGASRNAAVAQTVGTLPDREHAAAA